ncbi:class I SAM-dependent methyltransferase [Roseomonas nepalensis]|uniref:Class I SAM-dependent methyltransferase n=1 Tax=Muricoccus nepalensis TaxID=1854500 RepID=A0A502FAI7_9PROT|nr:class I SAM-dependent methyltransferase [Roseomonas nepalensis]TPG46416.1 class I SAM-dependent methyltransferase [Roseomonas nepalensis]
MSISISGLLCTVCRSDRLNHGSDTLTCRTCGQDHPVLGGVPVMFNAVAVNSEAGAEDDLASRQVAGAFDLPDDPLTLLRIRTMLRMKVRFGNLLVQAESQQFLHRVRNSGHEVEAARVPRGDTNTVRDMVAVPRYRWTKDYLPRRFLPSVPILANIRLENVGAVPLYRSGEGCAQVALRWQHRDGASVPAPDMRTPLPIDLAPGCAVTIAIHIAPPERTGAYLLTATLVQENVRWLDEGALTLAVKVSGDVPGPVPEGWLVRPDPPASYDADHDLGCALLQDWLRRHASPRPRVLEVGGNAAPMLARLSEGFGTDLVNADVDLLGLQIARLRDLQRGAGLHHVCADAFDLPFPSGHFDAIVIFASLHHFPEPDALLERLRHRLRPGGFIGLFCEPVGHVWPGAVHPAFLTELERGVNEQSFSLREYELMFRRADLKAAEVEVDMNSLKARLVHAQPDGAR